MGFFELLMHTLTWAMAFIFTFNVGMLIAIYLVIRLERKNGRDNDET